MKNPKTKSKIKVKVKKPLGRPKKTAVKIKKPVEKSKKIKDSFLIIGKTYEMRIESSTWFRAIILKANKTEVLIKLLKTEVDFQGTLGNEKIIMVLNRHRIIQAYETDA